MALIASCSGVPKNQAGNSEQAPAKPAIAVSNEQAPTEQAIAEPADTVELSDAIEPVSELADISQPEAVPEEPALAEAASEEEKPQTEYVSALSLLDDQEIAVEPQAQSAVAMESLRPAGAAPSEPVSPVKPASPSEAASPSEPASKPAPPVLPERRTAQIVPPDSSSSGFSPPVRESWRQLPKEEAPAVVQEPPPVIEEPQEERVLLPDYPMTFSRTARVTVGQLVEIPFRGKDWVFIGEVGARRGIAYDSRKTDPEGDSFIFRVDAAGTYALKFYRHDFAHDIILNDHVQIIAGRAPETTGLGWFNPPVDRSRVVAGPRWPNFLEQAPPMAQPPAVAQPPVTVQPPVTAQPLVSQPETAPPLVSQPVTPPATAKTPAEAAKQPAVPPAAPARQPARNETPRPQGLSGGAAVAQASPAQPESQPQPPAPQAAEPKSPDAILKEARDELNAGHVASAITLLDEFRKSYPSGSDEAWWLYGQCFEANSPNRNMLAALEYYRRLVREYPMSSRLSDARRRISYLERYYINIQ